MSVVGDDGEADSNNSTSNTAVGVGSNINRRNSGTIVTNTNYNKTIDNSNAAAILRFDCPKTGPS